VFFSIKLKEYNVWAGKRDISYFVRDDSFFAITNQSVSSILIYGADDKRRRVFSSMDEIRRSFRGIKKETVLKTVNLPFNLTAEVVTQGKNLGKFSNYVVVDLTNGKTYRLDDVLK
jgi:hypothetical protein